MHCQYKHKNGWDSIGYYTKRLNVQLHVRVVLLDIFLTMYYALLTYSTYFVKYEKDLNTI